MSNLIYQRLLTCRQVSLQAESRESSQMRWNHHGHGQVTVTEQNEYVRFQENLVTIALTKSDDLILDGRAIPRTNTLNLARIHCRSANIL